jgi:hypothetical protein
VFIGQARTPLTTATTTATPGDRTLIKEAVAGIDMDTEPRLEAVEWLQQPLLWSRSYSQHL